MIELPTHHTTTGTDWVPVISNKKACHPYSLVPTTYIFNGDNQKKGICIESFNSLNRVITALFPQTALTPCGYDEILSSTWKENDIIIFPGGKCSDWNELLSDEKQEAIYHWWKSGGRIFGVCAGAYFCSKKSSYQLFSKVRKIALFSGECQGPAYSLDLKVVKIRWIKNREEGYVTLIQGGFFIPQSDLSPQFKVLAIYLEEPHLGKIAVVSCKKKKGMAILSAPHWEFGSEDLKGLKNSFPHLNIPEQKKNLEISEDFRKHCLSEMLKELSQ